jgi:hypothetical protein
LGGQIPPKHLHSPCEMRNSCKVYVETGKKKTFAGVLEWPGWCRSGRDENTALQTLFEYGQRYAQVLNVTGIDFQPPSDVSEMWVTERHEGNSTTDFGAPSIVPDVDQDPFNWTEYERSQQLLGACWLAFDDAVQRAMGKELRKGPRGGGRDLQKMIDHVLDADRAYLGRLAWKHKRESGADLVEELNRTREAIRSALEVAAKGELPAVGPRGGVVWPARYFVRRVAWHVLDHTWEIEDRI